MVDVEEALGVLGQKRKLIGDQGGVLIDEDDLYGEEMENALELSETDLN